MTPRVPSAFAVALACAWLLTTSLASGSENRARFALVIGNNRPDSSDTPSLSYADDDAVATHRLLREAGVESSLFVTLDEDSRALYPELATTAPRLPAVEHAVERIETRMRQLKAEGRASELLIFYSGHGDVDRGEGYVVLEGARLTRTRLHAWLARSSAARNHVFVDACKSYFLAFEKGPGGKRTPYARSFLGEGAPAGLRNTGFVLSTSSDRDSHEWERYQAGILSHELRSALRGAADVDLDGRVTYAELGAFLQVANRAIPNERFRPDFLVRPPGDDLGAELLRWDSPAGTLELTAGTVGHLYVETAQGVRVLDAHPAPAQAVRLHVPPERPLFVRQNDESAELVLTANAPLSIDRLPLNAPEVARRGALHLAFERLFSAPFAQADVLTFARAEMERARADQRAEHPERDEAPRAREGRTFRYAAAAVTFGAAAAGLTLSTLSLVSYVDSAGRSQVEVARENQRRRTLNLASVGCYALAGAAGAAWAWSALTSETAVTLSAAPGELRFELSHGGRF
jgi:hypothetical protein